MESFNEFQTSGHEAINVMRQLPIPLSVSVSNHHTGSDDRLLGKDVLNAPTHEFERRADARRLGRRFDFAPWDDGQADEIVRYAGVGALD